MYHQENTLTRTASSSSSVHTVPSRRSPQSPQLERSDSQKTSALRSSGSEAFANQKRSSVVLANETHQDSDIQHQYTKRQPQIGDSQDYRDHDSSSANGQSRERVLSDRTYRDDRVRSNAISSRATQQTSPTSYTTARRRQFSEHDSVNGISGSTPGSKSPSGLPPEFRRAHLPESGSQASLLSPMHSISQQRERRSPTPLSPSVSNASLNTSGNSSRYAGHSNSLTRRTGSDEYRSRAESLIDRPRHTLERERFNASPLLDKERDVHALRPRKRSLLSERSSHYAESDVSRDECEIFSPVPSNVHQEGHSNDSNQYSNADIPVAGSRSARRHLSCLPATRP